MKRKSIILCLIIFCFVLVSKQAEAQRFRLEENGNIELEVDFDAYRVNNSVQFVWNTNTEANITKYEIRRGNENGRFVDWETLAVVKVDRTNDNDYTFVDESPILGEMHYQLRILAPDGSSVIYSPLFKVMKNSSQASARKKIDLAKN